MPNVGVTSTSGRKRMSIRPTSKIFAILLFLAGLASAQSPDSSNPYVRKVRPWAISGEIGANGLATLLGPIVSYYVAPQVALDFGLGISVVGLRPGIRGRYNFSMAKLSPFVSGAFKYGLGTQAADITIKNGDTEEKFRVKAEPSAFLDLAFGLDYLANNGFLLMGTLGYSARLGGTNYKVMDGFTPADKSKDVLALMYGSGLGLTVSLGKAF